MKQGWSVQLMSSTAAPMHLNPCEDARKSILLLPEQELLELKSESLHFRQWIARRAHKRTHRHTRKQSTPRHTLTQTVSVLRVEAPAALENILLGNHLE